MSERLLSKLEEHGYRGRVVAIHRLHDLQDAIEDGYRHGLLDEEVYRRYLAGFAYRPPVELPEARSLIVVAYPDPQVRFTFGWRGERIRLDVPPTYLHGRAKDVQIESLLNGLLSPRGYRAVRTSAPHKRLAVCSGLAEYGKNNIAYVAGMGSFHRLVTFCSDLPCERYEWREPRMLERCERCHACWRICPVDAIMAEQFLLRAGRCITFWNEKPWQVPFPEWMDAAGHNSLVGCMHCQRACPENRMVLDRYEEGAEFSEEETTLLLEAVTVAALPAALVEKLQHWDLLELFDVLPRNLRALLER